MLMGPDGEGYIPPPRPQPPPDPKASYQPDMKGLSGAVHTAVAADNKITSSDDKKGINTADNDWGVVYGYMTDAYRRAEQSDDPTAALASLDKTLKGLAPKDANGSVYKQVMGSARSEVVGTPASHGKAAKPGESAPVQQADITLFTAENTYEAAPTQANATALVSAELQVQLATQFGAGNDGVYTGTQIAQAISAVQAQNDPQLDGFIQYVGFNRLYGELQNSPSLLGLTPAEQQLLHVDPITLTFLMLDKVPLQGKLSPQMLQLAQQNSSLFAYLEINGVNITIGPDASPGATATDRGYLSSNSYLTVTVNGKPYVPGANGPTLNDLAGAYLSGGGTGGLPGVATALLGSGSLKINPGNLSTSSPLWSLIQAADTFRLQYAGAHFKTLLSHAPGADSNNAQTYVANTLNPFLTHQLNGFLTFGNPESGRGQFWTEVTAGGGEGLPAYITKVLQSGAGNGGDSVTMDYSGVMNSVLQNASPEEAQGIITTMMTTLNGSSALKLEQNDPLDAGAPLFSDFNTAVQLADQQPGITLTTVKVNGQQVQVGPWGTKVANWILTPGSGGSFMGNMQTQSFIGTDITSSQSPDLGAALFVNLSNLHGDGPYNDQFVSYMKISIASAVRQNSQALASKMNSAEYADFQKYSAVYLNSRFGQFENSKTIGVTLPAVNDPALRNAIGKALGYAPNQNKGGNSNTQDFYGKDTQQGKVIALDVSWILNQAGPGGTVMILPYMFASSDDGLENGVFFETHTRPSDNKGSPDTPVPSGPASRFAGPETNNTDTNSGSSVSTSWIDGLAAVPALELDPNANKHPDSVDVKWHYSSFSDFQLNNDLYQNGTIYMLAGNHATVGANGNVEVTAQASSRSDAWKDFKTTMDIVAGVSGVVGGILLAPFTAGTSTALTVTGAVLLGGSIAWNAAEDGIQADDMVSHGEHYGWSNPNAHQAIEGDVMTAVIPATLAMGGGAELLNTAEDATGAVAAVRNFSATGLSALSKGVGTSAAVFGGVQSAEGVVNLVQNWGRLSWAQRGGDALNIGINVASFATEPLHEKLDEFLQKRREAAQQRGADVGAAAPGEPDTDPRTGAPGTIEPESTAGLKSVTADDPGQSGAVVPGQVGAVVPTQVSSPDNWRVVPVENPQTGEVVPAWVRPGQVAQVEAFMGELGVLGAQYVFEVLSEGNDGDGVESWRRPGSDLSVPGAARFILAPEDRYSPETVAHILMPIVAGASEETEGTEPETVPAAAVPVAGETPESQTRTRGIGAFIKSLSPTRLAITGLSLGATVVALRMGHFDEGAAATAAAAVIPPLPSRGGGAARERGPLLFHVSDYRTLDDAVTTGKFTPGEHYVYLFDTGKLGRTLKKPLGYATIEDDPDPAVAPKLVWRGANPAAQADEPLAAWLKNTSRFEVAPRDEGDIRENDPMTPTLRLAVSTAKPEKVFGPNGNAGDSNLGWYYDVRDITPEDWVQDPSKEVAERAREKLQPKVSMTFDDAKTKSVTPRAQALVEKSGRVRKAVGKALTSRMRQVDAIINDNDVLPTRVNEVLDADPVKRGLAAQLEPRAAEIAKAIGAEATTALTDPAQSWSPKVIQWLSKLVSDFNDSVKDVGSWSTAVESARQSGSPAVGDAVTAFDSAASHLQGLSSRFEAVHKALMEDLSGLVSTAATDKALGALGDTNGPLYVKARKGADGAVRVKIRESLQGSWGAAYHEVLPEIIGEATSRVQAKVDAVYADPGKDDPVTVAQKAVDSSLSNSRRLRRRDPEASAVTAGERAIRADVAKVIKKSLTRREQKDIKKVLIGTKSDAVVQQFVASGDGKKFLLHASRDVATSALLHEAALDGAQKALRPRKGSDPLTDARTNARDTAKGLVQAGDNNMRVLLDAMSSAPLNVSFDTDPAVRTVQARALDLLGLAQSVRDALPGVQSAADAVKTIDQVSSVTGGATSPPTSWDPAWPSPRQVRAPSGQYTLPDPAHPDPTLLPLEDQIAADLDTPTILTNAASAKVKDTGTATVEQMSADATAEVQRQSQPIVDDEVRLRLADSEPAVVALASERARTTAESIVDAANPFVSAAGERFADDARDTSAPAQIGRLSERSAAAARTGTPRMKTAAGKADELLERARAELANVVALKEALKGSIGYYKTEWTQGKVVEALEPEFQNHARQGATNAVAGKVRDELSGSDVALRTAAAAAIGPRIASGLESTALGIPGDSLVPAASGAARTEFANSGDVPGAVTAAVNAATGEAESLADQYITAEAGRLTTDANLTADATSSAATEARRVLRENYRVQVTSDPTWAQVPVDGAVAEIGNHSAPAISVAEHTAVTEFAVAEGAVQTTLDSLDPTGTGKLTSTPLTFDDDGRRTIAAQAAALRSARERLEVTLTEARGKVDEALTLQREETHHLAHKPGGQNLGAIDAIAGEPTRRLIRVKSDVSLWLTKTSVGSNAEKINRVAVLLNDLYRETLGASHVSDVRLLVADDGSTATASRLIKGLEYPSNDAGSKDYYSRGAVENNGFWKLLGVSALFDNTSLGSSGSGDKSGDVGFLGNNLVVLDTDSGFGIQPDGSFSLPDHVDLTDFRNRLPDEVKQAFDGMGPDLQRQSYAWAGAAVTDELIDTLVRPVDSQLAQTLKSRRDSLLTQAAGANPTASPAAAGQLDPAKISWANSLRKFQFPDGYEPQVKKPGRVSRTAVYLERLRVDRAGTMHRGPSLHPSLSLDRWDSIVLKEEVDGTNQPTGTKVLKVISGPPGAPNEADLDQLQIRVNPNLRHPTGFRWRQSGVAGAKLLLDVGAATGGLVFRAHNGLFTGESEGRSLFDLGELHGLLRSAALQSVSRGHLFETTRLISDEVGRTVRLIGQLRKRNDVFVPFGLEEQIRRNAADFLAESNKYVKTPFGDLDGEPSMPAGLTNDATEKYKSIILELRKQHVEAAFEKYSELQKNAMGEFTPQNLHWFHPSKRSAAVSRNFQRLTYAMVIGSAVEPLLHSTLSFAGETSLVGIGIKVGALAIDQVVHNRPYPWEEGRLGRFGKLLDLTSNPVFGVGAIATVVGAVGQLHSPADWVAEVGHGLVAVGAETLGVAGFYGKAREKSLDTRLRNYQRDLGEYQAFFQFFPEKAADLPVLKKPHGVPDTVIALGAGAAVVAGASYNVINVERFLRTWPPAVKGWQDVYVHWPRDVSKWWRRDI